MCVYLKQIHASLCVPSWVWYLQNCFLGREAWFLHSAVWNLTFWSQTVRMSGEYRWKWHNFTVDLTNTYPSLSHGRLWDLSKQTNKCKQLITKTVKLPYRNTAILTSYTTRWTQVEEYRHRHLMTHKTSHDVYVCSVILKEVMNPKTHQWVLWMTLKLLNLCTKMFLTSHTQ